MQTQANHNQNNIIQYIMVFDCKFVKRLHQCSNTKEILSIMLKVFSIQLDEEKLKELIIMKTPSMM